MQQKQLLGTLVYKNMSCLVFAQVVGVVAQLVALPFLSHVSAGNAREQPAAECSVVLCLNEGSGSQTVQQGSRIHATDNTISAFRSTLESNSFWLYFYKLLIGSTDL